MTIRVVLVDDQALVRAGFRMVLDAEADIEVVGEAADGLQAVQAAHRLRPEVVLMDIRMPNLDGIQATRRLAGPDVADPVCVLILTTYDVDEYVFAALRAGACGFLLKHTSPEELVAAIRTVASGEGLIAPAVTRRLIAEFARTPAAPAPPGSWSGSPSGNGRCWSWSPGAGPTPRSPGSWSLGRPRSRPTSGGC